MLYDMLNSPNNQKRNSPKTSPFLNKVRDILRLKHLSRRTGTSYVYYMIDLIRFHGKRHPKDMGVEEIRAYLSHLATEGNVVASTQNAAVGTAGSRGQQAVSRVRLADAHLAVKREGQPGTAR